MIRRIVIATGAMVFMLGASAACREAKKRPPKAAPQKQEDVKLPPWEKPKLPAFPGAEGFGAVSKGGRGGKVIKVTNLKSSGPGSLAAAVAATGPRVVVFDVSGVIDVGKKLHIGNGQLTIAGQTAPGAGITLDGALTCGGPYRHDLKGERVTDVIVRFLRVRASKGGDAVGFIFVRRYILDHLSISWGTDENMGLSTCDNFTVQWCANEESECPGGAVKYRIDKGPLFKGGGNSPHNYGMIVGYVPEGNVSLHHNLWAHHNRRTPLCGIELMDHRNNVVYNVKEGIMFHGPHMNKSRPGQLFAANIIGNYFKPGPSCPKDGRKGLPRKVGGGRCMVAESGGFIYAEGNYFGVAKKVIDVWKDRCNGVSMRKCIKAEKVWPAPEVTTHKAEEAYKLVLAQAGCLPRDAIGKRTVTEVREGKGEWGRHDPKGGLMEGLKPGKALPDGDKDGMPDAWEKAHKLNPGNPNDAKKIVPKGASKDDRHAGYTYIEYYINELADKLIAEAVAAAAATK